MSSLDDRRGAVQARFPTWAPVPLDRFLAASAATFGDRPLVLTDDVTLTYPDVDAWATRLADGLVARGVPLAITSA